MLWSLTTTSVPIESMRLRAVIRSTSVTNESQYDESRGDSTGTRTIGTRWPAEISSGHRVPIVRVPVLTPRLSSYWLALVTDVDTTTGRNLIDSMSTEVVVTDTSIRELVPGEPIAYEEAVRRALEETPEGR